MEVKIIRSTKRKKTISAREVDGCFVIRAPADLSNTDLRLIVEKLQKQWLKKRAKASLDDGALHARAQQLNYQYFDNALQWQSIKWVTNQESRFGSCTPSNSAIRLSHRVASMPDFVRDYVIVHELAHLLEANHGPGFWKLVNRYPKTERARGYLIALALEKNDTLE